jgi:pimeloyl-ACP methyl ester carboxylesterase
VDVVAVNEHHVGYEQVGHGPPVVLVHGYVGDGRSTWRPQLDALGEVFTLVAWDAPGAGASSDPPEDLGMAGYADCLAELIAVLGLDRPHLVGLSFGGALVLELHRRHPTISATLTLVSAYAGWGASLSPAETEQRLAQARALADLPPDALVDALLPTMFSAEPPRAVVDGFEASLLATHPVGLRAMAQASAEDLLDALPTIDVPTLVVHGDQDVRAPRPVADQLHASIAGSELVILEGAGHVCNLEVPERFNEVLRSFLLRHPA